jgi:hypothetical protein
LDRVFFEKGILIMKVEMSQVKSYIRSRITERVWTWRFMTLQCIIASVFLAIVFADRVVVEIILKPANALSQIRIFHFVFFNVMSTVIFASLGAIYCLARGNWKISLGIFLEGIIAINLGLEDYVYFILFKDAVPTVLPWLNWNPVFVGTTYVTNVTGAGLQLAVTISLILIGVLWIALRKELFTS